MRVERVDTSPVARNVWEGAFWREVTLAQQEGFSLCSQQGI